MSRRRPRQPPGNGIELREIKPGIFALEGDLDFSNVSRAITQSARLFGTKGDIVLDLNAVKRTDSAGLALLVEWVRAARRQQRSITFENLPTQMMSIAKVSGLDAMLPIKPRDIITHSTH